jgi:hypothetical protein
VGAPDPFQADVARVALHAARQWGFALAGGHALIAHGLMSRPTEDVERPLRKLAKEAAAGAKHRRRRLQRAWKTFRKAERFWRA